MAAGSRASLAAQAIRLMLADPTLRAALPVHYLCRTLLPALRQAAAGSFLRLQAALQDTKDHDSASEDVSDQSGQPL